MLDGTGLPDELTEMLKEQEGAEELFRRCHLFAMFAL